MERQEWPGTDPDRPLTDKGITRTRRSVSGLLNLHINFTHLFSSPLARAQETAYILQRLLRLRLTVQICRELLPAAASHSLFTLLDTLPPDSMVLCVGHEPQLSVIASTLLMGKPCAGLSLKKAGACHLHIEQPIRPANAHLQWWLTAKQLRALA